MTRDIVRAACVVVVLAVAASLVVEVRFQLAAIDTAQRRAVAFAPPPAPPVSAPEQPGRLRAVGRAILDLADAGLGVVR